MLPATAFNFDRIGWQIWRGTPRVMTRVHSHMEVEFNLVTRGRFTYRFAGERVRFEAGGLYVFGGLTPHTLARLTPGARFVRLTVPLAVFLQWRLPVQVSAPILRGEILRDRDGAEDRRRFARWWEDMESGDPQRARAMLPEVQARLERMALSSAMEAAWRRRAAPLRAGAVDEGTLRRVEMMLHAVATRFAERLTLAEIARETGWHPHYAAGQFRRWIGLPPGEFLLQQRVAHARHLLATEEAKVIDVAEACGFGAQSSFYSAFTRVTGQTPAAYRTARRDEAGS